MRVESSFLEWLIFVENSTSEQNKLYLIKKYFDVINEGEEEAILFFDKLLQNFTVKLSKYFADTMLLAITFLYRRCFNVTNNMLR